MKKFVLAAVAACVAVLLAGCAVAPSQPSKRPMPQSAVPVVGNTSVAIAANNEGVVKSWFMTDSSAASASYGLLGGLVSGIVDAIMNAGPSRRATKAANEVSVLASTDALNASLLQALSTQTGATDAPAGISLGQVTLVQKILKPDVVDGALEVAATYTLSEDASTFRVVFSATYQSDKIKYVTPYVYKKVPKAELTGPVYTNVFTYNSTPLPVPSFTPEMRERLVASIEESYREAPPTTADGKPQDPKTVAKAMAKELEGARDDKLTKDEIAIFLTREWIKDGGDRLRHEVEQAHSFLAKYLVRDLNFATVPRLDGTDELLETLGDQRTVRRLGTGIAAGSYVSSPGGVTDFATYGNATAVAKANWDRIDKLRDEAKAAARK